MVEFSISVDRFEPGRIIAERGGLEAELERIVPTENSVIPYVWATGDPERLEELTVRLEASEKVADVESLDELAVNGSQKKQQLFRIEWILSELDIIRGVINAEGVITEGQSMDGYWLLRFRFQDHDQVAAFYQHLADEGITEFRIGSIYELTSRSERGIQFDLTPEQREAITVAAQRGYFSTPREVTLTELGEEFGITEQAFSQRLRKATKKVVLSALNMPGIEPPT